jgi:serine/threonine-protein kinase HipA
MGTLQRQIIRGKEALSFEYENEWLERGDARLLDPQLQFVAGPQFTDASGNFGLFTDSAPDRWGRLLIQRRENREAERVPLFATDYLLAVCDISRLGGLRFKAGKGSPFLAENSELPVPPMHALRELEEASRKFEHADPSDPQYREWLNLLLAPGTSLGGARPKATVMDPEGNLWVAKFPSRSDEFDIGAWETLVYQLASEAGIDTVEARAERFSTSGHTFMIKRFDRAGEDRIHFASAMTLLGYHDGDNAETGAGYLDLVELIEHISESPAKDLEELWRRIVFNMLIHNTDDHLRNHGFLLGTEGWRLSPVYDLNPQPWPGGLSLNVDESHNDCDLELARSVAEYFRLNSKRSEKIISKLLTVVQGWEQGAKGRSISRDEVERMRGAFGE